MKRRSAVQLVTIAPAMAAAQQHQHGTAAAGQAAAKPKFFTPAQLALVDELAEMILPADAHSPGAREAKVAAFIDDVVADLGADGQRSWTAGLEAVDAESNKRFGKTFLRAAAAERDEILREMAAGEKSPKTELQRFFVRIKAQTISGYYTSSIGLLKELEYKGNLPLAAFPPCNHPDHHAPRARN